MDGIAFGNYLLQKAKIILQSIFCDKDGRFVIAQFPNTPFIIWVLTRVVEWAALWPNQSVSLSKFGTSFLFVWAYLELTSGVNLFRKVLGAIVVTIIVVGMFSQ